MSVSPQPIVLIRVTVSILYSYSILQNLRTILNIVLKDRLTFSLNPQGTSEAFVGSSVNFFFFCLCLLFAHLPVVFPAVADVRELLKEKGSERSEGKK